MAAPIGYSSLPGTAKDPQKVKMSKVIPGDQDDYTDNSPASNNAVRANAFPQDFHERVHDMGHGMQILPPVLVKGATAAIGGTFLADDYFWRITALGTTGESAGSNEVTATLALDGTQVLSWAKVDYAVGYNVYRGAAADAEDTLVVELGDVATYTDTGTAGTAVDVPTTGDAVSAVQGDGGF